MRGHLILPEADLPNPLAQTLSAVTLEEFQPVVYEGHALFQAHGPSARL